MMGANAGGVRRIVTWAARLGTLAVVVASIVGSHGFAAIENAVVSGSAAVDGHVAVGGGYLRVGEGVAARSLGMSSPTREEVVVTHASVNGSLGSPPLSCGRALQRDYNCTYVVG